MANIKITVSAPVRYAYYPAQPQRTVGLRLLPGTALIISEKAARDIRFVAEGEVAGVEITRELIP